MTLRQVMQQRGYGFVSIFHDVAEDIYFDCIEEICETLGYIFNNVKRIDAEIPDDQYAVLCKIFPNYPIRNGYTSGGYKMKRAPQYRIYFNTIRNIPEKLYQRLQNDNQMRITGSLFVEACFFIGFLPGNEQFDDLILPAMEEIFPNRNEFEAFDYGCRLSSM